MSTAQTARRIARHAMAPRRDLLAELRRLEHQKQADADFLQAHLRRTRQQLGTEVVESMKKDARIKRLEETLRRVDAERMEAEGQVRRLTADLTALRATVQPRDTSRIEDQATAPIDLRELRAAVADGRVSPVIRIDPIPVMPLREAPFAMDAIPSSPTDTSGETTQTLRVVLPAAG